jgi:SAM-dependent methyltransferase
MADRRRQQETGAAWNVAAAIYERDEADEIALLRSGRNHLLVPEIGFLAGMCTGCGRAIHLQCAGGSDTLALWQLGAAEVVGVDISEKMIAVARRKTAALEAPARWYCCDVLDAPHELDSTADLVYTGKGALPWIMDIHAWAGMVSRLLRPSGRLYLFEGHPLDWVWEMGASEYHLNTRTGDYFSEAVITDRGWPMFSDPVQAHADKDHLHVHERQWTLGVILNGLVAAGLCLERFEEHPDLFWNQFPNLPEDLVTRLPHTFSLQMRKAEASPLVVKT